MIINMSGGGASGDKTVTVHVTPGTGANVTCTNDKKTFTGTTDANGDAIFKLSKGPWTITAECSGATFTKNVNISEDCTVNISLEQIPVFTYTGDYEIVNDSDVTITSSLNNWKIRFLTSGTLTFTALNGAESGIDVFCVGGGGAGAAGTGHCHGGGGGYTNTTKNVSVFSGNPYTVTIGAGGTGGAGGASSAFGTTANGGSNPNGGSGGGRGGRSSSAGTSGASDGRSSYGTGQGRTTREFGESSGTLYSGGGGGGGKFGGGGGAGGGGTGGSFGGGAGGAGGTNTGGGGGGTYSGTGGKGGSGIVIIRNAREVA